MTFGGIIALRISGNSDAKFQKVLEICADAVILGTFMDFKIAIERTIK